MAASIQTCWKTREKLKNLKVYSCNEEIVFYLSLKGKQKEAKTFASVFMREKWLMWSSILFPFSCQEARARVCDILPILYRLTIFNTNTYWTKLHIYVQRYCLRQNIKTETAHVTSYQYYAVKPPFYPYKYIVAKL